jgi:hypothetical protein
VDLLEHTDRNVEELAQLAASIDEKDHDELLRLYELMSSEYAYLPVEIARVPYSEFVLQHLARTRPSQLLHSYGAIQCLEQLLDLVGDDGFILVNDYGTTQPESGGYHEHQRFSQATFIGVNFAELESYFGDSGRAEWVKPTEERESIHSRLLGRNISSETVSAFQELFNKSSFDRLNEPAERARRFAKAGRLDTALAYYRTVLERQASNWVLMDEVARFLTFALRDCKAGAEMAKIALSLNPTCSSDLCVNAHFKLTRSRSSEIDPGRSCAT